MTDVKIDPSWKEHLAAEFKKPYFAELTKFVKEEYSRKKIFPPGPQIFRAFDLCPFGQVKVVILGQDPYHTPQAANGLAFAINEGTKVQPSLKNIFKELQSDLGRATNATSELTHWAKQGVLLLNATLTVEMGLAGSHQKRGWEEFTDAVVKLLSEKKENLVFILWGAYAQKKGAVIDTRKHLVISSAHPSPFSAERGFFGSKPFSKTNEYLTIHQIKNIDW